MLEMRDQSLFDHESLTNYNSIKLIERHTSSCKKPAFQKQTILGSQPFLYFLIWDYHYFPQLTVPWFRVYATLAILLLLEDSAFSLFGTCLWSRFGPLDFSESLNISLNGFL